MNKKGEIRELVKLVKPEVAVLTAIEKSHLEGLKSLKNIADAKSEVLEGLNKKGCLIINNDTDPDNNVSDFTAQLSIPTLYNAPGTTFLLGSLGAFQYIHGCNNASLDIFQYYVSDGTTQSEFQDSVLIYILNEAPFGEPDFYSVDNGETLIVDDELSGLLANDVDSSKSKPD